MCAPISELCESLIHHVTVAGFLLNCEKGRKAGHSLTFVQTIEGCILCLFDIPFAAVVEVDKVFTICNLSYCAVVHV